MKFVNLTPYTINEMTTGKSFHPGDTTAIQIHGEYKPIPDIDGIPLKTICRDMRVGIPQIPEPNTVYTVIEAMLPIMPKSMSCVGVVVDPFMAESGWDKDNSMCTITINVNGFVVTSDFHLPGDDERHIGKIQQVYNQTNENS